MSRIYPMSEEKLTSDSLEKATELIENTIYEAMDKLYLHPEDREHKRSVYQAWNLIVMFGDLSDNEGMFEEFAYQYNENHGLE